MITSISRFVRAMLRGIPLPAEQRSSLGNQLKGRARGPEILEQRIAPATVTAGSAGSFVDADGDAFIVKLTGPGAVEVELDDPDGDGRGSIASLVLSGTTAKSKLSVAVKKGGDREVSIGTITGTGDLASFAGAKSDLVGAGIDVTGTVGSLKLSDLRNGADIRLAGTAANKVRVSAGEIGDGSDLTFGAAVTKFTATHVGSGEWSAPGYGSIATKGGGFGASILATATAEQLGKTLALRSLKIVGGDLSGDLSASGGVGTISVKHGKSGGGNITDATIAAASFKTISASRDVTGSVLLAGANLGADFAISADDTFGAGTIGKFAVGGNVAGSVLGAGLVPGDFVVGNGDDGLVGGTQSVVKKFAIKGTASADSLFAAGVFPQRVKIGGSVVTPVSDPRFLTLGSVDVSAPVLNAALVEDTGASDVDRLTLNPNISGRVTDNLSAPKLSVAFGASALVDVSSAIGADGRFTLDAARLATINGGALPDGAYTLRLQASDTAGNTSPEIAISFQLDRTTPGTPIFDLSAGSDTGVIGDQLTSAAVVQLTGRADPNVSVLLGNRTALASSTGTFIFPDVALANGDNLFTASVVDLAGNVGQSMRTITRSGTPGADVVLEWNATNLEAIRLGAASPPIATRGLAMTSGAMFDVIAAFEAGTGFFTTRTAPAGAALEAAVASAAHDVLVYLFPGQQALFDATFATSLGRVPDGAGETSGVAFGAEIADTVIAIRSRDGFNTYVDYASGSDVGDWQQTAPMFEAALLPNWPLVDPFVMNAGDQFRPDAPPGLDSAEYAAAFNEVKMFGAATGSARDATQTQIARFWADGSGTYTPPGHWNQIAMERAAAGGLSTSASARLLVQLNTALADAAIVSWDAKYFYDTWRPSTAIHDAALDGNAQTASDAAWESLLITPPFPEYTSGHSTFSGAASAVLTAVFGEDLPFSTTSLGLPGVTRDFDSFEAAAEEAGQSRIYGGIHFQFANQAGLESGRELAAFVLGHFAADGDFAAPKVVLDAPEDGLVTNADFALTGRVFDNISGVESLTAQLDNAAAAPVTFAADGSFSIPITLPADGAHTLTLLAADAAGNGAAPRVFSFTADRLAPTLTLDPALDGSTLVFGSALAGTGDGTGSLLRSLSYAFDGGAAIPVGFDAATGAFSQMLDLSALGAGAHTLAITATDSAGLTTTTNANVNLAARIPFTVLGTTPMDTAEVGTTFRPQVFFSRPVDLATLNANNFFATRPDGAKLAATIVPGGGGDFAWLFFDDPMPGGAEITMHVEGATILAAADAAPLDADGNGTPGGTRETSFATVSLAPLLGTSLSGRVFDPGADLKPMTFDDIRAGPDGVLHTADDVFLNPLAGVKVFIVGLENQAVFTDATGAFRFASAPAGNVKLAIDGRTATNAPAGFFFPEMVMDLNLRAGAANTSMGSMGTLDQQAANSDRGEVYLPRLRTTILQSVSGGANTMVGVDAVSAPNLTAEQRALLTLEVQPGSLLDENGAPVANPMVGLSTVPEQLVREMLPPGVLQHTFDITIQAPGAAVFNTPLEITFPNVFNAAPGTTLNFLSFDHTTGRLVIEGTATVSADGLSATTDPGMGITKPGWHGLTPPGLCVGSGGAPLPIPQPQPGDVVRNFFPEVLPMIFGSESDTSFEWRWQAPDPVPGALRVLPQIPGCNVPQRPPPGFGGVVQPFLHVNISVDGPLETFMKSDDLVGGLNLISQSFTLPAGQAGTVSFAGEARTYGEMFLEDGFENLTRDQLYGSQIKITEIRQAADGSRTFDNYTFYLYRWVDVVNAFTSELPVSNTAAFHKTLAIVDAERTKNVDVHLPASVETTFTPALGPGHFGYGGPVKGETMAVWTYMPEAFTQGSETEQVKVQSGGQLVGSVNAVASCVAPTVIDLNEPGFKMELERVIRALNAAPGPDGTPGTVDDVITYPRADGRTVTASDRFETTFAGFLPADRQPGPDGVPGNADDTFTGGDVAVRAATEFAAAKAAIVADFNAVQAHLPITQRAYLFLDVESNVRVLWNDLSDVNLASEADIGVDFDAVHDYVLNNDEIPGVAKQRALAELLNSHNDDGPVEVSISAAIDWDSGVTLGQKIANATSHVLGNTFGLERAYVASAPFENRQPLPDLMNASDVRDGDRAFQTGNISLLQAALGFHPNADDPLTVALSLVRNTSDYAAFGARGQHKQDVFVAPELAVSSESGALILPDSEVRVGDQVAADGPGDRLVEQDFVLTNPGTEPVTITATTLSRGAASPFKLLFGGVADVVINPGEVVTLTVVFDPTSAGDFTDTLTVTSNARTTPVFTIPLIGTGIPFQPTALALAEKTNFGGVAVAGGAAQIPQFATISNTGFQPLTITEIAFAEGDEVFDLVNLPSLPITLSTGEVIALDVGFNPIKIGNTRGVIEVETNDPEDPTMTITAVGTGLGEDDEAEWADDFVAIEFEAVNGGNITLRTTSDDEGHFEFFLPPGVFYHLTIFDPETGLFADGSGTTGQSGQGLDVTSGLVFLASDDADDDFDGLSNEIELALGTSDLDRDSDGDGLDDFTEIAQGTNPLDGFGGSIGIDAGLDFGAVVGDIELSGGLGGVGDLIGYAATGSGLSIFTVGAPGEITLRRELLIAGGAFDVGLDGDGRMVALVAANALHFVDVTDPDAPMLMSTIGVDAVAVEAFSGVAYVISGGTLRSIDISTGETIQTLNLSPSDVNSLTREGSFLYTVEEGGVLRIIDISNGTMTPRGTRTLPSIGYDVFVGGGLAVVGAEGEAGAGGFMTLNVSDPDNPTLISDVDSSSVAGGDGAADGAGGLVTIGAPPAGNGAPVLDVLNIADPTNTGAFLTRIPLPGTPNALAIANGRAYVAAGNGVFEVNYAGFDATAEPPVVNITSLLPDADPGTPGVQIPVGSTIPFLTQVNSDAPVRNVVLLVNGEVAATDVSFPWGFSTIARDPALGALALAAPASPITVQARATDTAGNVSLSNVLTFALVPDSVAPSVSGVVPADGSSATPGKRLVTVNFSEPIDPASAAAGDFVLQGPGGQFFAPQNIVFRNDERTAALTYAPLPAGSYTLTIGPDITDRAGNPMIASAMSDFDLIAATTTFTGAVNNQWIEPGNWSTGTVPGASDIVFVPAGNSVFYTGTTTIAGLIGGGTIRGGFGELIVTGAGQIGRLVLSDPAFIGDTTLNIAGTFTVTELLDWSGGTVRGAGMLVVPASATLTLSASGARVLNDATLDLEGAGTWTGTGSLSLQNTAVFSNEGSFTDAGNNTFSQSGSGNAFNNAGTFTKSGGTGITAFGLPFNNTGTAVVQSGTIDINRSGSSTGLFTAAAGATIRFSGSTTYQLDAGTSFTGAGRALLTGGTLNIAANVPAQVFEQTGGTLTGAAAFTVTSALTWSGGIMSGTGSTDVAAAATFTLITTSGVPTTLDTRVFNNAGTATWTGNGGFSFVNGADFNNTGSFIAQNNVNFIGNAASVFNNSGTFVKTIGTGTTQANISFANTGTVTVESGTLGLPGGLINNGVLNVRKIATILVNGTFTNPTAGTINLDIGGIAAADFASVMVTGAATLNGTLNVFIVDGFTPGAGDTFQVLTYAGRTGSFATISDDDPAHVFNPAYNATNLTLTVA